MSIPKLKPYQPDPYIKLATDQEIAKFGHLNWLIGQINQIAVGGIQSIIAGTDISVDITDPQNPIINYTGGAGGGEDLDQTLTLGDDANQQNIVNLNTLQGGSAILLTITDDNSGGILLNPTGPATIGSVGDLSTFTSGNGFVFQGLTTNEIDASTCTKITIPQVVLSAGLVGTPSLTFVGQTDMGVYKVSGTQMGISVAGALQMTIDSVIGGIAVGTIGELVGAAGVSIAGRGLIAPAGMVGAPSYSFTGSLTTGLYAPAANQIGIAVSGALDFQFSANTFTALAGSTILVDALGETTAGHGVVVGATSAIDGAYSLKIEGANAGASVGAQLSLGVSATPSLANNGDIWFDGTHIYIQIGGVATQMDN